MGSRNGFPIHFELLVGNLNVGWNSWCGFREVFLESAIVMTGVRIPVDVFIEVSEKALDQWSGSL